MNKVNIVIGKIEHMLGAESQAAVAAFSSSFYIFLMGIKALLYIILT